MEPRDIPEPYRMIVAEALYNQKMQGAIMDVLVASGIVSLEQLSAAILAQAEASEAKLANRLGETARMLFAKPPTLTVIEGGRSPSSEPEPQK